MTEVVKDKKNGVEIHHKSASHKNKKKHSTAKVSKKEDKVTFTFNKKFLYVTAIVVAVAILILIINSFSKSDSDIITGQATMTVLNDERCQECYIEDIVEELTGLISGLNVERYDYMQEKGKEIYALGLDYLPALLFDEPIKQTEFYSEFGEFFELNAAGNYHLLKIGAFHDPTREICDNGIDDTGNGLVDCEDPDCADTLLCNPDILANCAESYGVSPNTVIFYYSETCPWCTRMMPGIEELEEEGYSFKWVLAGDQEDMDMIYDCFMDYMGSGVPQFICPKTAEIRPGAFADQTGNLNLDAMRTWVDVCANA